MSNASIVLSGVHLELTDAIKAYVTSKAERLLRHNPRIIRIDFELSRPGSKDHAADFAVQAQIIIAGPDIVASVESDDLYKSVDLLVDKLDRALRRRHRYDKVKRHLGGDGWRAAA